PQIDVWSNPACHWLVVTQTRNQAQHPTSKINHTVNKPAAITVEQTQHNDDYQQYVDRINSHSLTPSTDYTSSRKNLAADFADYSDCIICVICENLWPMLQFLNISN